MAESIGGHGSRNSVSFGFNVPVSTIIIMHNLISLISKASLSAGSWNKLFCYLSTVGNALQLVVGLFVTDCWPIPCGPDQVFVIGAWLVLVLNSGNLALVLSCRSYLDRLH